MKKLIAVITLLALVLTAACSSGTGTPASDSKDSAPEGRIVCTVFPQYDWVRNIIGEDSGLELTMLLDSGVDLHSFQPTAADVMTISGADMFIYVGGNSDKWVDDTLSASVEGDIKTIDLMEALGGMAKEEKVVEGMQAEEEEEDEAEGPEYDEHIWLSVKNAVKLCGVICDGLCGLYPDKAETFRANCAAYCAKLTDLDEDFTAKIAGVKNKTVLFCDRYPFMYLTDDYGIDYYAAFVGCSAESNASFKTISFLAGKVNELELDTVFVTESPVADIASTVLEASGRENVEIRALDSMQSVTKEILESGEDYYSAMKSNFDILAEVLAQ